MKTTLSKITIIKKDEKVILMSVTYITYSIFDFLCGRLPKTITRDVIMESLGTFWCQPIFIDNGQKVWLYYSGLDDSIDHFVKLNVSEWTNQNTNK
jgi:hypothetical protein